MFLNLFEVLGYLASTSGNSLAASKGLFGPSWGLLGVSWGLLGSSWKPRWAVWGFSWDLLEPLGPSGLRAAKKAQSESLGAHSANVGSRRLK